MISPFLRNVRHWAMIAPVSPLLTRLIHISPSCWTIYRSFESILKMGTLQWIGLRIQCSTPGFLNVRAMAHWRATEEFLVGQGPCITEIEYVSQDEPLIQGFSTWAAYELTGLTFSKH